LSDQWKDSAYKTIKIPMLGSLDSMNVSVAAGIILFEVCRQRKINHITS
jgi:TrmH family RNA methyltransferase